MQWAVIAVGSTHPMRSTRVQAAGGLTCCMAYATAKGGLLTLTRNNAAALGPHGIKVHVGAAVAVGTSRWQEW